jgi:hypothetical protein
MNDWTKHLNTKKHLSNKNQNLNQHQKDNKFLCQCGKKYKYLKTMKRHQSICCPELLESDPEPESDIIPKSTDLDDIEIQTECESVSETVVDTTTSSTGIETITKELLIEVINQNKELKKMLTAQQSMITEYCKQPKTVKNNFNLNFFLNVECKDALNISDFVKNLSINIPDLEHIGRFGYVEGVSRIIVNALQQLDLYKRPIHCTDIKREVLFVKDEDKWDKDQNGVKVKKAIGQVAQKNCQTLCSFIKPETMMAEHPDCDKNLVLMKNVNGGNEETRGRNHDKILSIISKNVVLEQQNPIV